uniref:HEAT repeat domain-containing protein n=1 Tax=Streptomyces sp. NBC_00049 TaxID=2903617 RepID=A0AAU2JJI2_9ACTN
MHAERQQESRTGRAAAERLTRAEDTTGDMLPSGAGPGAWTAFDQAVRDLRRPGHPCGHLALRLCHPDGRTRASALNAPHPPLPLVAIRCADWVPAVRERARQLLDRALAEDPAGTLSALTPLVLRLGGREQGGWALERFEAALRADGKVLAGLRDSPDLRTRRFAARLSLEIEGFDVRELARRAAAEHDPVAGQLWTDAALAVMTTAIHGGSVDGGAVHGGAVDGGAVHGGAVDQAVDILRGGRLPLVRAAGVTALRRAGRAGEGVAHLADRSGFVRACARWLVRQDGGDPYALCREAVEDPGRVSAHTVTGFAECAVPEDVPLLRALLAHPAEQVRAAAVGALRLLGTPDLELLRPLLDDPSPMVAREASLSLRSTAGRLPAEWLLARIAPDRPAHTRRAAYRVLRARGGVAGLRASVELLTHDDPSLRRSAKRYVHNTFTWDGLADLPAGDPEVGALLDRCAWMFNDWVVVWLRSQLGLPRGESATGGY